MSDIQKICDTLVYRYLVENRHCKTAELFKEERKKLYTLKKSKNDEKISKKFSFMIAKYEQLELDTLANNLVCDYLKLQENPQIQKLAKKVKSLLPSIQVKGDNPSIGDILKHANVSRKNLVRIKKKLSNQLPGQAKSQKSSMKNVSGIAIKSKLDDPINKEATIDNHKEDNVNNCDIVQVIVLSISSGNFQLCRVLDIECFVIFVAMFFNCLKLRNSFQNPLTNTTL